IINSTGDENIGYSYQITPNPVSENLIITDRMCNQRMDKLIHIRDLNGKNILAERWSSTCVKEISTRNFMSGVFILSVENSTSGKNLFTSRILINR
ncbi:MAG: T9SS type A sorting domain-containing protein, partial [Saprospiraceae bacterium]